MIVEHTCTVGELVDLLVQKTALEHRIACVDSAIRSFSSVPAQQLDDKLQWLTITKWLPAMKVEDGQRREMEDLLARAGLPLTRSLRWET